MADGDIVLWGKNIIDGERERVRAGGVPMSNPTVDEVAAEYNNFLLVREDQSKKKDAHDKAQEALDALRPEADELIKDIWDEIDYKYRKESPSSRRRKAREYGVKYSMKEEEEDTPPAPESPPAA